MDRTGLFAGDNPFQLAQVWLDEAEASEPNDPNAIALATVDASGLPNVRMVLLKEIETDLKTIEDQMQEDFPPKLEEVKRIKLRKKKDGSLYSNVTQAKETYPLVKEDGEELVCYDYETFNPGSPKMRIDRLWEAGWRPVEKTKGHKKWLREQKPSRFFGTTQKHR